MTRRAVWTTPKNGTVVDLRIPEYHRRLSLHNSLKVTDSWLLTVRQGWLCSPLEQVRFPVEATGHSPTWVALQMSRTCSLVSSIVAKYRKVVSRLL